MSDTATTLSGSIRCYGPGDANEVRDDGAREEGAVQPAVQGASGTFCPSVQSDDVGSVRTMSCMSFEEALSQVDMTTDEGVERALSLAFDEEWGDEAAPEPVVNVGASVPAAPPAVQLRECAPQGVPVSAAAPSRQSAGEQQPVILGSGDGSVSASEPDRGVSAPAGAEGVDLVERTTKSSVGTEDVGMQRALQADAVLRAEAEVRTRSVRQVQEHESEVTPLTNSGERSAEAVTSGHARYTALESASTRTCDAGTGVDPCRSTDQGSNFEMASTPSNLQLPSSLYAGDGVTGLRERGALERRSMTASEPVKAVGGGKPLPRMRESRPSSELLTGPGVNSPCHKKRTDAGHCVSGATQQHFREELAEGVGAGVPLCDDPSLKVLSGVEEWVDVSTSAAREAAAALSNTEVRVEMMLAEGRMLPHEAEALMSAAVRATEDSVVRQEEWGLNDMGGGKPLPHMRESRPSSEFRDSWATRVQQGPGVGSGCVEPVRNGSSVGFEDGQGNVAAARVRGEVMRLMGQRMFSHTSRGERGGGKVVRVQRLMGGVNGITREHAAAMVPLVMEAVEAEMQLQSQNLASCAAMEAEVSQRELMEADDAKRMAEQKSEELEEQTVKLTFLLEESRAKVLATTQTVGGTRVVGRKALEHHLAVLFSAMGALERVRVAEVSVMREVEEIQWCIGEHSVGQGGPVREAGMSLQAVMARRKQRGDQTEVEELNAQLETERKKLRGFPAQRRAVHLQFYLIERATPTAESYGRSKSKALEDVTNSDYGAPRSKLLEGGPSLAVAREVEQWVRRLCTAQQDALGDVVPLLMFLVECDAALEAKLMMSFCEERLAAGVVEVEQKWLLDGAECDGLRSRLDRQLTLVYMHLEKILPTAVELTHHSRTVGGDTRKEVTVHAPKEMRSGWLVFHWWFGVLREVSRAQVRVYNDMYRDCWSLLSTMGISAAISEIEKHFNAARELGSGATYPDTIQNMYDALCNHHGRFIQGLARWEVYDPELSNFDNVLVKGLSEFLKDVKRVSKRLQASQLGKPAQGARADCVKAVVAAKAYLTSATLVDSGGTTARAAAVNFGSHVALPKGGSEGEGGKGKEVGPKCSQCADGKVSPSILKKAKEAKWKSVPTMCYKCYAAQKDKRAGARAAKTESDTPLASANLAGGRKFEYVKRDGDWECPSTSCKFKNFKSRDKCYKCGTKGPGGTSSASAATGDMQAKLDALTKRFEEASAKLTSSGGGGWKDD